MWWRSVSQKKESWEEQRSIQLLNHQYFSTQFYHNKFQVFYRFIDISGVTWFISVETPLFFPPSPSSCAHWYLPAWQMQAEQHFQRRLPWSAHFGQAILEMVSSAAAAISHLSQQRPWQVTASESCTETLHYVACQQHPTWASFNGGVTLSWSMPAVSELWHLFKHLLVLLAWVMLRGITTTTQVWPWVPAPHPGGPVFWAGGH